MRTIFNNISPVFFKVLLIATFCTPSISVVYSQNDNPMSMRPTPYERGLRNPMMGFTSDDNNHPWASTTHTYIKWNELENLESDGLDKILAVSNAKWGNLASTNKKAIPRVYLHWSADDQKYWPSDMQTDDYTSEQFQERVLRLIERLGIAWDNDPRIAFIELGIFGKWGEHHSPSPTPEMQQLVGDAFAKAFKNKKVSVRHFWNQFTQQPFGEYWDSWAHYDQMWPHGKSIHNVNSTKERYLHNYIGGEVAYDWGNGDIQPGSSPTSSVAIEKHRDFVINSIRWLHCTQLRWIANYDRNNPAAVAGAEEIQKAFGYRYVLNEVRVGINDSLSISFDVTNEGSAPFYYEWPVEVSLLDPATLTPVWTSTMKNADIRDWLPGSGWTEPDWTSVGDWRTNVPNENWNSTGVTGWANAPEVNTIEEEFSVDVPDGSYIVALAVLDPSGNLPALRFATANYINGGRHPLFIINTSDKTVQELPQDFDFDEPFNDKSLYYDPTFELPKYTITSDTPNGSISLDPEGGSYLPGTVVKLSAVGDLGYAFDSWGGDLSGTENPMTLTMDGDKHVSATFNIVPTYNLNIESEYGQVALNPPGGIYSQGTVVTLTPVADLGYIFESWGGDASGLSNPTTIIIDGSKSIIANFVEKGTPIKKLPWIEDFNIYANGTTFFGGPITWTAERAAGTFSVQDKSLVVNGAGDQGIFQTGIIDISDGPVNLSIDVAYKGGIDQGQDYIKIYKSVDGGVEELIDMIDGNKHNGIGFIQNQFVTLTDNGITGSTLQLIIKGYVTYVDEYYYVDNLIVTHPVQLTTIANNGSVTLNPSGGSYTPGILVTATAIPNQGYKFTGWSGDLSGSDNPASLTMDGNKEITAHFTLIPTYTFSMTAVNGTVTIDPPDDTFEEGTVITLTAIPDEGYKFSGWSGDLGGTQNPANLTMDSNKEIVAQFTLISTYTLSVTAVNGTVTIVPSDDTYVEGTLITLTAIPDEGYMFSGWSGDLSGTENPASFIVDADLEVTALFAPITNIGDLLNSIPGQSTLGQNYPNPFCTQTTIPYYLSAPGHVTLAVNNFAGQKVVVLVNEYQNEGLYSVEWVAQGKKGQPLASGLYFCRLETENGIVLAKKLLLTQ